MLPKQALPAFRLIYAAQIQTSPGPVEADLQLSPNEISPKSPLAKGLLAEI